MSSVSKETDKCNKNVMKVLIPLRIKMYGPIINHRKHAIWFKLLQALAASTQEMKLHKVEYTF